jgi:hypothetical protein
MIGKDENKEGTTKVNQNTNDKPKTRLVVNIFIFYFFKVFVKEKENVHKHKNCFDANRHCINLKKRGVKKIKDLESKK